MSSMTSLTKKNSKEKVWGLKSEFMYSLHQKAVGSCIGFHLSKIEETLLYSMEFFL